MSKFWTGEEDAVLLLQRTTRRLETIGRRFGRTYSAAYSRARRLKCWPTKCDLVTSTVAGQIAGVSPQYLTRLAKSKRIKARRIPGGRWWLFDLDVLEVYKNARG